MSAALVLEYLSKADGIFRVFRGSYTLVIRRPRSSRLFFKKGVLKILQNAPEKTDLYQIFFLKIYRLSAWSFIKEETSIQVLSFKLRKIFQKIFFTEHLWTNASGKGLGSTTNNAVGCG